MKKNRASLAPALIGALGCFLGSNVAYAQCHAKDLDFMQLMSAVREVNDSTVNLRALQSELQKMPVSDNSGIGLLGVAIQVVDRAVVEASMFGGYLTIYSGLINDADRQMADHFISTSAPQAQASQTGYADYLTIVATAIPRYGDEIRHARDRIRSVAALFSCAGAGAH